VLERLGMIGSGGIAATLLEALACELPAPLSRLDCLTMSDSMATAEALLQQYHGRVADTVVVHDDLSTLLGCGPQMVIECAGHGAVREHGPAVLAAGIEDDPENATRFAWIARASNATGVSDPADAATAHKTALVFWGGGDLAPGWLVACLTEFSSRAITLTRIESRPRRIGLGHYMFFCDLLGAADDPAVADAIAGLRSHCEAVRVLGSFPAAA